MCSHHPKGAEPQTESSLYVAEEANMVGKWDFQEQLSIIIYSLERIKKYIFPVASSCLSWINLLNYLLNSFSIKVWDIIFIFGLQIITAVVTGG